MSAALHFLQLSPEHRRLVFEASWCLLLARLRTSTMPFHRIASNFDSRPKSARKAPTAACQADIIKISTAIDQASRRLPLTLLCLQQALAAKRMLDRRNIANTLFLGTRRDQKGRLQAHAWLRSNGIDVTGGDGSRQHTVLSRYY